MMPPELVIGDQVRPTDEYVAELERRRLPAEAERRMRGVIVGPSHAPGCVLVDWNDGDAPRSFHLRNLAQAAPPPWPAKEDLERRWDQGGIKDALRPARYWPRGA